MKQPENKKYGLLTAICTVIGTVIGSGIFFKAESILKITDGDTFLGLCALILGGGIMLVCAATFASMDATEVGVGGVVGYAESLCGGGYARAVALFSAIFYLPTITAAIALASARYFCMLVGFGDDPSMKVLFGGAFLVSLFVLNSLSPRSAGVFQIGSTVLKLLPLVLVALVGGFLLIFGEKDVFEQSGAAASTLFPASISAAFAYEGWIVVTSMNDEINEPEKNIPKALFFGAIAVLSVYVLYYIGISGSAEAEEIVNESSSAVFVKLFGSSFGGVLTAFITVSCVGALNGMSMAVSRGCCILSDTLNKRENRRGRLFSERSEINGIPFASAIMGLFFSELWLVYYCFSEIGHPETFSGFDPAEISIAVMYGMYIPIFVSAMIKRRGEGFVKRFALPLAAVAGALFLVLSAVMSFGVPTVVYLLLVACVMLAAEIFCRRRA